MVWCWEMSTQQPHIGRDNLLSYAPVERRRNWIARYWMLFLLPLLHPLVVLAAPYLSEGSHNPDSSLGFAIKVLVVYMADFPVSAGMMFAVNARDVPREGPALVAWFILTSAYWFGVSAFARHLYRSWRRR